MGTYWRHFLAAHRPEAVPAALLAALLVLFFRDVGTPVLHLWDEARLAVNAVEMLDSGDWLVTRYQGQPDLWNTKPPLLIWLQAGCLHWLGYTAWALRLPSALAALATAWTVYRFGRYTLGSRLVGGLAALALATSPGFNGTHVARFGDYDALLCLGLTAAALRWYRFAQQRQARHLWWGAGWFALALLTKSAAAGLLLPAMAAGLLCQRAGRWVFGQWRTYAAVGLAFGPLLLFYGLREAAGPGYLAAVWFNDWYGRLSQHIVSVQHPWWIYFQRLLFPELLTWSLLLPVGVGLAFRSVAAGPATPAAQLRFARFAGAYGLVFLLILSGARTRLGWYSAPVFPMAALLCALGLAHLARHASRAWRWSRPVVRGLVALAVAVPAGVLLHHEASRWEAEKADPSLHFGYQLPALPAACPGLRAFTILPEPYYNATLFFYAAALRRQGFQPTILGATDAALRHLRPGQRLLMGTGPLQRRIGQHYDTRLLAKPLRGVFLEIIGPKPGRRPAAWPVPARPSLRPANGRPWRCAAGPRDLCRTRCPRFRTATR